MKTTVETFCKLKLASRAARAIAFGLLLTLGLAQTSVAQNPLNFGNNYFVTGDYVVAGVGLRGLGGVNGLATGQIKMPDATTVPAGGVPPGADIVAALLFWATVESSQTPFAGQNGFFRPLFYQNSGGPAAPGYPIVGAVLGNPNAPVSWSSGGCNGSSNGAKTMRTYSADVRALLPVDSNGNVLANSTYEVSLADSGSNGGGAPLTLGASLVIIYRAITPGLPLNSVVIFDGAFAPSNSSSSMTQPLYGFYQAADSPISKLTHIVGNGQSNKFETVSLNNVNLPSLYGNLPSFPGHYNGSWDNPTWNFPNPKLKPNNPVQAGAASATTAVGPTSQNGSCVSWGVVIVGTTVKSSGDGKVSDGLIDTWKTNSGYCDASVNGGVCRAGDPTDPAWVDLTGAKTGQKDLFVELDYMCSSVTNGTCDTTPGNYSFYPPPGALTMMTNSFSSPLHPINVHFITGNPGYPAQYASGAIPEQTCHDTVDANGNPSCPFPEQPGIVGWKAGFESLKQQPLNMDEASCEAAEAAVNPTPPCIRRFQHGRKDSYHYALFAHALGLPDWTLLGGSLSSVVASGNTVTFTTSTAHGLVALTDRVTIADAITNPSLNGTYSVQTNTDTTFTITIPTATNATYTLATDPELSVTSGRIGTRSGFSDIGGADTLVTLGLWGDLGQTDKVQGGTFMHELGHSNGLTHGGLYYDQLPSYFATFEPNCKPNYQSVMSYLFQVDLLDNGVLDYSEQGLNALNEGSLPAGVTPTSGSLAYSTTKWYMPTQPFGVGTAATSHCDGSPLSNTDPNPTMYLATGPANPITPAWVTPQSDVNFDGTISAANLRGYNDWASLDLRQIGATGSDTLGGGGKGIVGGGGKGIVGGGGKGIVGGGGKGIVGGGGKGIVGGGGLGHGEFDLKTANSYVRSPRNLTASSAKGSISLTWAASTFGKINLYNIYKAANGIPVPPAIASVPGNTLTYPDNNVACGPTYTYFVTASLADGRESVPSNSVSLRACAK